MSARERILTIRLLDKLAKYPMFFDAPGIEREAETPGSDDAPKPP